MIESRPPSAGPSARPASPSRSFRAPTPEAAASPVASRSPAALDRALVAGVFLGSFALLLLRAPGLDYFLTSRDHGYQVGIGGQVLQGATPGVDIVCVYGPMAMLTSALGLRISGSLLGETLLCSGGYALCFTLLYVLARRDWSRTAGLAAAAAGYALMARYYKWYVWLIPLATLWGLRGWIDAADDRKRRWLAACGLIVGLGWLYRLDMGTLAAVAVGLMIAAAEFGRPSRRLAGSLAVFVAAASALPIAWTAYLAAAEGIGAPWTFLSSSFHGALVVSRGMAAPMVPLPSIILGFTCASAVLVLSATIGVVQWWRGDASPGSRYLLATALVALATAHQATHRRDPAHLLQVVPPLIAGAFAILATARRAAGDASRGVPSRAAFGSFAIASAGILAYATYGLTPFARWDLVPIGPDPIARLKRLAHPTAAVDHPGLAVVQAVRENSAPGDAILVFPLDSQLLTLAERRMSGRLHGYYAGVFDAPDDARLNLDAVLADPPVLVVVPSPKADPSGSDWPADELARKGRAAHAYLEGHIRADYPRTVFDDGRSAVLAR
ncbi:MAG: hypothetical protein BGO49_13720 [Planctomycetales bacterium 71-10]|nr:MAG: hypothetical protein BGO49_13720 [Planctomycetales bacterium 71-10]